jgi:hypothetical protein
VLARLLSCTELPRDGAARVWLVEVEEGRVWTLRAARGTGGAFRFEWVGTPALDPNLSSRVKSHARRYVLSLLAHELVAVELARLQGERSVRPVGDGGSRRRRR